MKLDRKGGLQLEPSKPAAQPFKKLLAEAERELRGAKKPQPAVAVVKPVKPSRAANATQVVRSVAAQSQSNSQVAQVRHQARAHADSEATRLGTVRAEHARTADTLTTARSQHAEAVIEKGEARIIDFIVRELSADASFSATPAPKLNGEPAAVLPFPLAQAAQPAKIDATPDARASQAVALIEKIETFVKSQRPGLALTLNNSLGAHVEIERIGPREIALKLVGHRGPPSADAISRIRDELRARGLKIGALSVA